VALFPFNPKAIAWAARAYELEFEHAKYMENVRNFLRGVRQEDLLQHADWEQQLLNFPALTPALAGSIGLDAEMKAVSPLPSYGLLAGEGLPDDFEPLGPSSVSKSVRFRQRIIELDEMLSHPGGPRMKVIGHVADGAVPVVFAASGLSDDPGGTALYPFEWRETTRYAASEADRNLTGGFWHDFVLMLLRTGAWNGVGPEPHWSRTASDPVLWIALPEDPIDEETGEQMAATDKFIKTLCVEKDGVLDAPSPMLLRLIRDAAEDLARRADPLRLLLPAVMQGLQRLNAKEEAAEVLDAEKRLRVASQLAEARLVLNSIFATRPELANMTERVQVENPFEGPPIFFEGFSKHTELRETRSPFSRGELISPDRAWRTEVRSRKDYGEKLYIYVEGAGLVRVDRKQIDENGVTYQITPASAEAQGRALLVFWERARQAQETTVTASRDLVKFVRAYVGSLINELSTATDLPMAFIANPGWRKSESAKDKKDVVPRFLPLGSNDGQTPSWYGGSPLLRQVPANRYGACREIGAILQKRLGLRGLVVRPMLQLVRIAEESKDLRETQPELISSIQKADKNYRMSLIQVSPGLATKALMIKTVAKRGLSARPAVTSIPPQNVIKAGFILYGWDEERQEYGPIGEPLVLTRDKMREVVHRASARARQQHADWEDLVEEDLPQTNFPLTSKAAKAFAAGELSLLVLPEERAKVLVGLPPGAMFRSVVDGKPLFVQVRGPVTFDEIVAQEGGIPALAARFGMKGVVSQDPDEALRQFLAAGPQNWVAMWALGTEYEPVWAFDVALSETELGASVTGEPVYNPMLALRAYAAHKLGLLDLAASWLPKDQLARASKGQEGVSLPLPFKLFVALQVDRTDLKFREPAFRNLKPWEPVVGGRQGVVLAEMPLPKSAGSNIPLIMALEELLSDRNEPQGFVPEPLPKSTIRTLMPSLFQLSGDFAVIRRRINIFAPSMVVKTEMFDRVLAKLIKKARGEDEEEANKVELTAEEMTQLRTEAYFGLLLNGLSGAAAGGRPPSIVGGGQEALLAHGGVGGRAKTVGAQHYSPSASQKIWAIRGAGSFGSTYGFVRRLVEQIGVVTAEMRTDKVPVLDRQEMEVLFARLGIEIENWQDTDEVLSALEQVKKALSSGEQARYQHKVEMGRLLEDAEMPEDVRGYLDEMAKLNPRKARRNPVSDIEAVVEYVQDTKSGEKRQRAEGALASVSGVAQRPLTFDEINALFPRKGSLTPDTWNATDRVRQALTVYDPIRRVGRPPETIREAGRAAQDVIEPAAMDWARAEAELSLDEALDIIGKQRASRQMARAIPASAAIAQLHRKKRLRDYRPPINLFAHGRDQDVILWMSPDQSTDARVITYRRGDHIDADLQSRNPQDLPELLGRAIQASMIWLAEKDTRTKRRQLWVGRIGFPHLALVWKPGDPLTIDNITRKIETLLKRDAKGDTARVYNREEDMQKDVLNFRAASYSPLRQNEEPPLAPTSSAPPLALEAGASSSAGPTSLSAAWGDDDDFK
jgi:hypothetical protein